MAILPCVACVGCVSGSLASNTGPRATSERWSTDHEPSAHVGELVQFDFVLKNWMGSLVPPLSVADYCVFTVGQDRMVAEPNPSGHFSCAYRFDTFRPGDVVNVEAAAYRQLGSRDWINARGQWLQPSNPADPTDSRVAADALRIRIYQAEVVLKIPPFADDLDFSTAILRFSPGGDRVVAFGLDQSGKRGFQVNGPEPEGTYTVRFLPPAEALTPTDRTRIVFTIKDLAGQLHTFESSVDSP